MHTVGVTQVVTIPPCGATVRRVTELVSMLVPLDAFATAQPSWIHVLGLLIGVPAIIFVVISVLTKSKELIRAAHGESTPDPAEPIWIGAMPAGTGEGQTSGEMTPVAGRRAAGDDVGGASVRW